MNNIEIENFTREIVSMPISIMFSSMPKQPHVLFAKYLKVNIIFLPALTFASFGMKIHEECGVSLPKQTLCKQEGTCR